MLLGNIDILVTGPVTHYFYILLDRLVNVMLWQNAYFGLIIGKHDDRIKEAMLAENVTLPPLSLYGKDHKCLYMHDNQL